MPRFIDVEQDYTFYIRIHPIIRMHFRQRGWSDLDLIADFCGVHIEDLCRACAVDALKECYDFNRETLAIHSKLGLTIDDLIQMHDYKPPVLLVVRGGAGEETLVPKSTKIL